MKRIYLTTLLLFALSFPLKAAEKSVSTKPILSKTAWSAVLSRGRVILIETDFLHLAAYSAKTGKKLWRRKFQEQAHGGQSLHLVANQVMCWAGNRIHIINPGDGKTIRQFSAAWNNSSERCRLVEYAGLCAFRCQCDMWFFDCKTGRKIGERYKKQHIEFHDELGSSGGCYGPGNSIICKNENLLLMTHEIPCPPSDKPGLSACLQVLALDSKSGRERWHCDECALPSHHSYSAISEDGSFCILAGFDDALRLFDLQTGELLASLPGPPEKKSRPTFLQPPSPAPPCQALVQGRRGLLPMDESAALDGCLIYTVPETKDQPGKVQLLRMPSSIQ
ncbi:MAG: PQQ-binding-like beta-propeller repeat protein [Deltaproteobacteria bacterium]|nr:PQQ-binding-like beta-propeller repeat protein [Deltaproteobacteria bacterium]